MPTNKKTPKPKKESLLTNLFATKLSWGVAGLILGVVSSFLVFYYMPIGNGCYSGMGYKRDCLMKYQKYEKGSSCGCQNKSNCPMMYR